MSRGAKLGWARRAAREAGAIALSFVALTLPVVAFAGYQNPLGSGTSDIWSFLVKVLQAAAKIGGVVAALAIMWAGFLYVTAQGDEGKITQAHLAFRWAITGTLLMLGATVFADAICQAIKDTAGGSFDCPSFS